MHLCEGLTISHPEGLRRRPLAMTEAGWQIQTSDRLSESITFNWDVERVGRSIHDDISVITGHIAAVGCRKGV